MASKKYTLLAALLVFFQLASTAQTKTDWGWDWKDSSKIPTKSIPQYNEFLNNQFPYPPKPRNAWELGLSIGSSILIGDRPMFSKNSFGNSYVGGYVVGLSLRKALGHVVSLRSGFTYSEMTIPSYNYTTSTGTAYSAVIVNKAAILSIDALFSLNSSSHYRGNPKTDWYLLGGYSLIATQIKGRNNTTGKYDLITYNKSKTAGSIQDLTLIHGLNYGGGVAFKISPKFNIGIEEKFTTPLLGNDYLDGFKAPGSKGGDTYGFTTIRFNINLGN